MSKVVSRSCVTPKGPLTWIRGTLGNTTVPSLMPSIVIFEQSTELKYSSKNLGSISFAKSHSRKYFTSCLVNLKFETNFKLSSKPQKMVNSPPNGFFRKSKSKLAVRSCVLFFQYAYAMVIWYASVSNAVARLFEHGGSLMCCWSWECTSSSLSLSSETIIRVSLHTARLLLPSFQKSDLWGKFEAFRYKNPQKFHAQKHTWRASTARKKRQKPARPSWRANMRVASSSARTRESPRVRFTRFYSLLGQISHHLFLSSL